MDIAAAPYPVKYALHDAVSVPTMPLIPMISMIVVQYDDWNGRPRTLVFEPTVPDGSAEAPFYRNLRRLVDKVPGGRLAERVVLRYYNEPADVLALLGLSPESDRRVVTHPPYPGGPAHILSEVSTATPVVLWSVPTGTPMSPANGATSWKAGLLRHGSLTTSAGSS
ncbi:hypothetical protein AB0E76_27750 [Streptomyces fungicidicus]|uniref:hypothetical protein n=1 Tax=Streptomyces TaxID=1883 RepID=UPI003397153A